MKQEKWYLRSSGHKDYFKIQEEVSDKTICYIDGFVESQFNDLQVKLQNIVYAHNISLKTLQSGRGIKTIS